MQIVKESIFSTAVRSFFSAFLAVVGVLLGFFVVGAVFSKFISAPQESLDSKVMVETLPDGNGVYHPREDNLPAILQIDLMGAITGSGNEGTSGMVKSFLRVSQNPHYASKVKAILLNIESPGGTVIASDDIYRHVLQYKEKYKVPVFAYTQTMAASGGYYVACSADKIYASPLSIVGSVGVLLGPSFNLYGFMQKHGISAMTLTEGKYKEKFPTFSPVDPGGASYQDLVEITKQMYANFVSLVAHARKHTGLTEQKLVDMYGAQVFSGRTAERLGYVDNGHVTYEETLKELAHAAGVEGDYQVLRFYERKSPFSDFVQNRFHTWIKETTYSLIGVPYKGDFENKLLYYADINPKDL